MLLDRTIISNSQFVLSINVIHIVVASEELGLNCFLISKKYLRMIVIVNSSGEE